LMATGGEGNRSQMQLGYGSCVWGTGRVTVCPPGPGATQRSSTAGMASDQDELHQSGSRGEDVTQSPPAPGDETEVVIRSQWHASEEPGEGVTQLAAHGIADGKLLSQFWRAGDVGSIRSTAGLPIRWPNLRTAVPLQYSCRSSVAGLENCMPIRSFVSEGWIQMGREMNTARFSCAV